MSKKKKKPQHNQQQRNNKPTSQLAKPQHISKEKKRKEAQRRFVERKKNPQTVISLFDGFKGGSFLDYMLSPEGELDSVLAEKHH